MILMTSLVMNITTIKYIEIFPIQQNIYFLLPLNDLTTINRSSFVIMYNMYHKKCGYYYVYKYVINDLASYDGGRRDLSRTLSVAVTLSTNQVIM